MALSSHWQIGINVKLSALLSSLIQIESPVMWLQSSSINTLTCPLNLRLLLFPAGTSAALSASSPCCHGDESWHKRQAGRHDVSQDLHPKARQRQVTIRGWSVTGRSWLDDVMDWSGVFRALLPVWLSTQNTLLQTMHFLNSLHTNNACLFQTVFWWLKLDFESLQMLLLTYRLLVKNLNPATSTYKISNM